MFLYSKRADLIGLEMGYFWSKSVFLSFCSKLSFVYVLIISCLCIRSVSVFQCFSYILITLKCWIKNLYYI